MFDLVHSTAGVRLDLQLHPEVNKNEIGQVSILAKVDEVIKFEHLEPEFCDMEYPFWQKYFLFGNERDAYLLHCVTKVPDFFQVGEKYPYHG